MGANDMPTAFLSASRSEARHGIAVGGALHGWLAVANIPHDSRDVHTATARLSWYAMKHPECCQTSARESKLPADGECCASRSEQGANDPRRLLKSENAIRAVQATRGGHEISRAPGVAKKIRARTTGKERKGKGSDENEARRFSRARKQKYRCRICGNSCRLAKGLLRYSTEIIPRECGQRRRRGEGAGAGSALRERVSPRCSKGGAHCSRASRFRPYGRSRGGQRYFVRSTFPVCIRHRHPAAALDCTTAQPALSPHPPFRSHIHSSKLATVCSGSLACAASAPTHLQRASLDRQSARS